MASIVKVILWRRLSIVKVIHSIVKVIFEDGNTFIKY